MLTNIVDVLNIIFIFMYLFFITSSIIKKKYLLVIVWAVGFLWLFVNIFYYNLP